MEFKAIVNGVQLRQNDAFMKVGHLAITAKDMIIHATRALSAIIVGILRKDSVFRPPENVVREPHELRYPRRRPSMVLIGEHPVWSSPHLERCVDDLNKILALPAVDNDGSYISISQQLTPLSLPNSKSGLSAFLNATIADDRTSKTDAQVAGGLMYRGLFRSRPNDDIAFAVGMTHVNGRVADAQIWQNTNGLGPVPVQGTEYVMELYYTFRPTSGLLFRPNVQYVIHPGGVSQNKDALIFGLKTSASF
jgi:hypothetical protein